MAGEWIKIRVDLAEDLAVIAMLPLLPQIVDADHLCGKLARFWGWASRALRSSCAPGVTALWLDGYVGVAGFAHALESVGWLTITEKGIKIPHFDRHIPQSAKDRALAAIRMSRSRYGAGATKPSLELSRVELSRKGKRAPLFSAEEIQAERDKEAAEALKKGATK